MSEQTYTVESGGERLDVYLAAKLDKTRSYIKHLNDSGLILYNGKQTKCGTVLKCGDIISVTPQVRVNFAEPQDLPLEVLYEDDDIAVINKQQGISVHPGAGNHNGTLVNALTFRFKNLSSAGGEVRPGIVHRLDKDTSGVLLVAKNDNAHAALTGQLSRREVQKTYLALLEGNLKADEGEVRTNVGRSPRDRKKMAVLPNGKEAITLYSVVKRYRNNCLVKFIIKTGRTHQIRVHAQYLGHPVVGDKTYGYAKQRFDLNGQLLHAHQITFKHPASGEEMTFSAPLPDYFEEVLDKLKNEIE